MRTPFLALLLAAASAAHAAPVWIDGEPKSPLEAALVEAVGSAGGVAIGPRVDALRRLAADHAGTAEGGLAHLLAGLLLVDAGRITEALFDLEHPDVARTALTDHAGHARGRALEALGRNDEATAAYLAASTITPGSPVACAALLRAAEVFRRAQRPLDALPPLGRVVLECPRDRTHARLVLGLVKEAGGDMPGAALEYDQLAASAPGSDEAGEALDRRARLAVPRAPDVRIAVELAHALALADTDRKKDATARLRKLLGVLDGEDLARARVQLAELLTPAKPTAHATAQARALLGLVPAGSAAAPDAALALVRLDPKTRTLPAAYESVTRRFPGSPAAEQALVSIVNLFQKTADPDAALPYYRALAAEFPDGAFGDRARWYSGWGHFRHREWKEAAEDLEQAARSRPRNPYAAAMFFWAARARQEMGEGPAGEALLRETVIRYKHGYHGQLAARALATLPGAALTPPVEPGPSPSPEVLPEGAAARVRALLLIDRQDEAEAELRSQPDGAQVRATLAWIEGRRGRLRPAIVQMKKAYPEHVSALGDQLPPQVWQVLYPLEYADALGARARAEGLDPALVAAVVLQESTFDPAARSRAGALGLMQIMPRTGREIARSLRITLPKSALTQPDANLHLGASYLRRQIDAFGGRVERALAAYNAGPGRVRQWTAGRPDVGADEFVENIPFAETRHYVMTILAARTQYQRLYALDVSAPGSGSAAGAPR